ncbi:hypothetical protein NP233_g9362 [Leucocoprinus birnbaumii]|uniref:Trichodiene synthase n=1 Tax=Leucocoprinus birnbaumii TaxID=56174 RepID=A0AAD5VKI8_9AGAR|nr:hypothetical protein NP233_g9362 [Leucocoprinus birnbaumii]
MSQNQIPARRRPAQTEDLRNLVVSFLKVWDVTVPHDLSVDPAFREACRMDAARRGIDSKLYAVEFDIGVSFADTAYRHLKDESTRIFIAVWTTLILRIDDHYEDYADGLSEFSYRLSRNEPQRYTLLDELAVMTQGFHQHWGPIASGFMVSGELDFFTSMAVEKCMEDMEIQVSSAPAITFPKFVRSMTGISRAYACMIFPADLDIRDWLQAVPDCMDLLDYINDVLSSFKEEVANDTANFVTANAKATGTNNLDVVQTLSKLSSEAYARQCELLKSRPEVLDAFKAWLIL